MVYIHTLPLFVMCWWVWLEPSVFLAAVLTVSDGWWIVSCCCCAISDNEGATVCQLVKRHERCLCRRGGTLGAGVGCYGRVRHRGQFNHDRRLPAIPVDNDVICSLAIGSGWTDVGSFSGRHFCHGFKRRRLMIVVVIHHFTVFRLTRKQDLHTWCSTFSITLRIWLEIRRKREKKKKTNPREGRNRK